MANEYFAASDPAVRLTTGRAAPLDEWNQATADAFDLLPSPARAQTGAQGYAAATGSAGAYAVTLAPWPLAPADGQQITMLANHTGPGAVETLTVNGGTAKPIRDQDGALLVAGDITAGNAYQMVYLTNRWQVTLGGGSSGDTNITQVTADSEVIRPEDFALGTDALNLAAAFAQGIATGTPVRLDGAYSLSAALSTITMTTGILTVIGNGTITASADFATPMISIHATYPTAVSISAILQTTRTFPGGSTATDCTRITAAASGCSIGDLIKAVSDDQIAISPEATSRRGEFAYVADTSGDFLYVEGYLVNTLTTTPRLVRVRREAQLVWDGPRFKATAAQTGWDTIFLQVRGFAFPRIRTDCEDGYDIGVNISSCFMAEVDVAGRNLRNRVSSEGVSGYLVQDSASAFTQARIRGVDARHAYTTDSPTSTTNDNAYLYGQTIGANVTGAGYACSSAAFDVHPEAIDCTFANITGGRTRLGEDASGALIQLRGTRNRVLGAIDRGSLATVQFFAQTAGGCIDCSADDINYGGTQDGVRISALGGFSITSPKVRGGLIKTSKLRSVPLWACTDAELSNLTIAPTGSATHEAFQFQGDADAVIRGVTFDLRDYTGTTFRACAFNALSTGNSLVLEDCRVINGSGKFATWFHGHSTSGNVVLRNLTSDVEPSGGFVQGTEALTSFQIAGGWTLVDIWDFGIDGAVANADFTDIAYDEVRVVARGVTKGTTGTLNLRVSTNNGSSYKTASGDYVSIDADGVEAALTAIPMHNTNDTLVRSGSVILSGLRSSSQKQARAENRGIFNAIETTSVVNAIRVYPSGGGNLTAGTITVFGR